jgi:hypothetical protein
MVRNSSVLLGKVRVGEFITKVDGTPVETTNDLNLWTKAVFGRLKLERGLRSSHVIITLGANKPSDSLVLHCRLGHTSSFH